MVLPSTAGAVRILVRDMPLSHAKLADFDSVETVLIDLVTIGVRRVVGRQYYGSIPAVETIALR